MRYCFAIFILLSFLSCRKENLGDCFKGTGKEISITRYPGEFKNLRVESKFDVLVKQGAEYKVEIIAGANLMRNIRSNVEGGWLAIVNNNTCNFVRGYKRGIKVIVTAPYFERVENHGVGPLTIDPSFVQDTLLVRAESSGDIHVNGRYNQIRTSSHGNGDMYLNARCNSLFVFMYGTNYTFAEQLEVSDYAFLHTLSIGDCRISVQNLKQLAYNIQSDGNIYYRGNPPLVNDFSAEDAKGRAVREE
jgi:hypothetical protein